MDYWHTAGPLAAIYRGKTQFDRILISPLKEGNQAHLLELHLIFRKHSSAADWAINQIDRTGSKRDIFLKPELNWILFPEVIIASWWSPVRGHSSPHVFFSFFFFFFTSLVSVHSAEHYWQELVAFASVKNMPRLCESRWLCQKNNNWQGFSEQDRTLSPLSKWTWSPKVTGRRTGWAVICARNKCLHGDLRCTCAKWRLTLSRLWEDKADRSQRSVRQIWRTWQASSPPAPMHSPPGCHSAHTPSQSPEAFRFGRLDEYDVKCDLVSSVKNSSNLSSL